MDQELKYPKDIIGREIKPGDHVMFYKEIYTVLEAKKSTKEHAYIRIELFHKSKSSRPSTKYSEEMCLINEHDFLLYMLKKQ